MIDNYEYKIPEDYLQCVRWNGEVISVDPRISSLPLPEVPKPDAYAFGPIQVTVLQELLNGATNTSSPYRVYYDLYDSLFNKGATSPIEPKSSYFDAIIELGYARSFALNALSSMPELIDVSPSRLLAGVLALEFAAVKAAIGITDKPDVCGVSFAEYIYNSGVLCRTPSDMVSIQNHTLIRNAVLLFDPDAFMDDPEGASTDDTYQDYTDKRNKYMSLSLYMMLAYNVLKYYNSDDPTLEIFNDSALIYFLYSLNIELALVYYKTIKLKWTST